MDFANFEYHENFCVNFIDKKIESDPDAVS